MKQTLIKKEKGMIKCPNCNSESITIERRPNGYCTCLNCKHRWKNGELEKPKPLKQIYIKTDMTEMPRNCKECRDKKTRIFGINNEWTIADAHCFYRETSTTGGSSRPLWCPLVEIMEVDEK